jgi:hypothetical protein
MRRVYQLLIFGLGLVVLDLVLKTGTPCGACDAAQSLIAFVTGSGGNREGRAPLLPAERISVAGVHYGPCAGTVLAVVLLPEPCGWREQPVHLASR